jgi:hypothetical protein
MRNANQQAKLYRRKDKKIDRQKKLHAPIVPDLNHAIRSYDAMSVW